MFLLRGSAANIVFLDADKGGPVVGNYTHSPQACRVSLGTGIG